jgi:hypothetical protein
LRFKTTIFLAQTQAKKHYGEGNIKVQRSFISYFGETAENNWSMVGKNFLNRFHSNGVSINALFDKQGRLIYIQGRLIYIILIRY